MIIRQRLTLFHDTGTDRCAHEKAARKAAASALLNGAPSI